MAKVYFMHKNGKHRLMDLRYAEILQKVGRGTFRECDNGEGGEPLGMRITKDLDRSAPSQNNPNQNELGDLDAMGRDALIAFAEEYDLKIDRRWGDDKMRSELREQIK